MEVILEQKTQRLAKSIADLGYCSRREAERLIAQKIVSVNGKIIDNVVCFVTKNDIIAINGNPIGFKQDIQLYAYYKPHGLVCTTSDELGRKTIFDDLKRYEKLPRLIYIGRLDLNSEGILLLTNNGEIAKILSAPNLGISKVYRVRAFGKVSQGALDALAHGICIEGIDYRPIIANIIRGGSTNIWLEFKLTEGKNREIRKVCEYLGLQVNRLIRTSFGPYKLADMQEGDLVKIDLEKAKSLIDHKLWKQIEGKL